MGKSRPISARRLASPPRGPVQTLPGGSSPKVTKARVARCPTPPGAWRPAGLLPGAQGKDNAARRGCRPTGSWAAPGVATGA